MCSRGASPTRARTAFSAGRFRSITPCTSLVITASRSLPTRSWRGASPGPKGGRPGNLQGSRYGRKSAQGRPERVTA